MFQRKARALLAMALATMTTGALAQQPPNQQPQLGTTPPTTAATPAPSTPGMPMGAMPRGQGMLMMGAMPMMGMMQMMMGGQHMAAHVEGRIAFLKAELKITGTQLPLWNAVAEAMRASAKSMTGMPSQMAMMQSATPLPEKLAAHEKMMATHLEGLRKLKAAIDPLYAALDTGQKKTADELMIGPMGMGMM